MGWIYGRKAGSDGPDARVALYDELIEGTKTMCLRIENQPGHWAEIWLDLDTVRYIRDRFNKCLEVPNA